MITLVMLFSSKILYFFHHFRGPLENIGPAYYRGVPHWSVPFDNRFWKKFAMFAHFSKLEFTKNNFGHFSNEITQNPNSFFIL